MDVRVPASHKSLSTLPSFPGTVKEVDNPVAFQCQLANDCWKTFVYAASELTGHVRRALDENRVLKMSFKWVKWHSWAKTGEGFYAAVDVTVKGS